MEVSKLLLLLLSIVIFQSSAEDCRCSQRFRPVCGNNGKTYDNECLFKCESASNPELSIAYNGTCCPQTICPSARSPVCDNFGHTHINECFLNRAQCTTVRLYNKRLKKEHDGECLPPEKKDEDCSKLCIPIGGEVCDEKGQTHPNECSLDKLNCELRKQLKLEIVLVHFGECSSTSKPSKRSSLLEEPGSGEIPIELSVELTSRTSESPDFPKPSDSMDTTFHVVSHKIDFKPQSDPKDSFSQSPLAGMAQPSDITQPCSAANCDKTWNPVCDSNNKTHRNLCLFKFYACKMNRIDGSVVSLAYQGECTQTGSNICGPCPLDENKIPVCDNLNQTHESLCEISHFNCLQRDANLPERVLVHVGLCHSRSPVFMLKDEKCPTKCGLDWKPVCDEVGVTHRNLCQFQQKNCNIRKKGGVAPMLKFLRACSNFGAGQPEGGGGEGHEILTIESEASVKVGDLFPTELTTEQYALATGSSPMPTTTATPTVRFECPSPNCNEDTSTPVCDSNGHFHENVCMFTYARCLAAQKGIFLTISQEEKCITSSCNEVCSNQTRPLCATDFTTYQNFCHYAKQKCVDHSLDILFNGHCSDCLPSPCLPLPDNAPDSAFVCDSEDITRTLCEYQMLSCIVDKNGGLNFTIQHLGRCCGKFDSCSKEPDSLLCGNDGRTYKNKCEFDLENCRNEKLLVPTTTVAYNGECKEQLPFGEEEGDFAFGKIEDFADSNSTIENSTCPSSCDNIYAPVCGSDDVTYTNLCFLQSEKCHQESDLRVVYPGECCEVQCPSNFAPVCDDQGTTHQNLCFFGKERCLVERLTGRNLSLAKFDVCTDDCATDCPNTYLPICGSNGITYINPCELEKQNCFIKKNITAGEQILKEYDGECCPEPKCDYVFSPVCDSEGTTHANDCIFRHETCVQSKKNAINITIQYKGACCNQPCEDTYNPVCDGQITHENTCRFRIAQCEAERKGEVLTIAYSGECCVVSEEGCNISESVCDSDGQTHTDMCKFRHKKCIAERMSKKMLSIVHAGECCVIEACKKGEEPVCDSRGGTHASLCHFQNTKCIHDKIHPHNTIQLAYKGSCCPNKCTNAWDPVCDQHGAVYKNKCFFDKKSCEQRQKYGAILLETPCPQRRIRRLS